MTQKDYIAVAAKIRDRQPLVPSAVFEVLRTRGVATSTKDVGEAFDQGGENMRRLLAIDLADVFAADNPRFKRSLFMTACGF